MSEHTKDLILAIAVALVGCAFVAAIVVGIK